ncbi:Rieske 2Fe-2S domain-containing protein [Bradyrhizobium sp. NP1]|uniref:Rieske 2Fe-2S domain-containing protein n=1 Tax=Bradyrhizobium sp. NP1 TaxID=3049772 RepID=UPI0025A66AE6|nr:Rieske 2Fe-2S domain-containing protein [Bradyrhizobium sp. NP1]WJR76753.1 Rieske 2Fe-2S domain-containing protein [Bradyrhizobium sp. NP1]
MEKNSTPKAGGQGYRAPVHTVTLPGALSPEDALRAGPRATATVGAGYEATRLPISEARHLPGYMYWHPEVFRLEKENMFLKDWLMVAREEEVEEPGDYLTLRILDEPIIVARDEHGQLHAFYNRCAHRGVAVAREGGNTNEFTCPYHGWLYDLSGKLLGAPHMRNAKNFDAKNCRLRPIALSRWGGWIFISFADAPVAFNDFIAEFDKDFGFLKQEDCRLAEKLDITLECNWKFAKENLMDAYHSPVLHKETIGKNLSPNRYTGTRSGQGAFTAFYRGAPMTEDNKSRFGIMPSLIAKGETEDFACGGHLGPNVQLFARSDNVHPFVIWPITPTKTRIFCYQLFPKEWFDHDGFAEKVKDYTLYTTRVLEEDSAMMDTLQDAAFSPRFVPGYMSEKELGVYNLLNINLDRIFGPERSQSEAAE